MWTADHFLMLGCLHDQRSLPPVQKKTVAHAILVVMHSAFPGCSSRMWNKAKTIILKKNAPNRKRPRSVKTGTSFAEIAMNRPNGCRTDRTDTRWILGLCKTRQPQNRRISRFFRLSTAIKAVPSPPQSFISRRKKLTI